MTPSPTTASDPLLERALDVLAPLPPEVRPMVRARLRVRVHAKGEYVVRAGEGAEGLHVVAAGRVVVVAFPGGDAVRLASLEAGDAVDDVEVVLCRRAEADAVAVAPTATVFLARADVEALLRAHPKFAHALYLGAFEKAVARERILDAARAGASAAEAEASGVVEPEPIVVVGGEPMPAQEPPEVVADEAAPAGEAADGASVGPGGGLPVEPTVIVSQPGVVVEPAARTMRLVVPPPLPAAGQLLGPPLVVPSEDEPPPLIPLPLVAPLMAPAITPPAPSPPPIAPPPNSLAPAVASAPPRAPMATTGTRTWLLVGSLVLGALGLSGVALSVPARHAPTASGSFSPPGAAIELPATAEAEIVGAAPTVARALGPALSPASAPTTASTTTASTTSALAAGGVAGGASAAHPPTARRAPSSGVAQTSAAVVTRPPRPSPPPAPETTDELGGRE
jgi:CRP-like cAMP-binding protein